LTERGKKKERRGKKPPIRSTIGRKLHTGKKRKEKNTFILPWGREGKKKGKEQSFRMGKGATRRFFFCSAKRKKKGKKKFFLLCRGRGEEKKGGGGKSSNCQHPSPPGK